MLVNIKSPVELLDYKLLQSKSSGKLYCALTFNNLEKKIVRGLKATIYCYDPFGDSVSQDNRVECKVNFQEGLRAFGKTEIKILLDNKNTRKIEVDIEKVLFDDKSIWSKDTSGSESEKVELNVIDDPVILEFVKECAGEDASYLANQFADRWTCVCGRINHINQYTCIRCAREQQHVLQKYSDIDYIRKQFEVQLEDRRKAQEEREYLSEKRRQKVKKATKISSIIVAVLLVIGGTIIGFMTNFTFSNKEGEVFESKEPVAEDIVENGIIKTTFEIGGINGLGDFTITYHKNGSEQSKKIKDLLEPAMLDIDNNGVKEIVIRYPLLDDKLVYWEDVYEFEIDKEELIIASHKYPNYYKDYYIPAIKKHTSKNYTESLTNELLVQAAEDLMDGEFIPDAYHVKIEELISTNILHNKLKITKDNDAIYFYGIKYGMNISEAIKILGQPDEMFEINSKIAVWYVEDGLELGVEYSEETNIIHYFELGEFDQTVLAESIRTIGLSKIKDGNNYLYLTPYQQIIFEKLRSGNYRVQLIDPDYPR